MQQQQQQQHQCGGGSLNRRSLVPDDVINTVLTSQITRIEQSRESIQAREVIRPGGAAL